MTKISPAVNPAFVRAAPDFGNSPAPQRQAFVRHHVIADIHWPTGVKPEQYDGCPISCSCGWGGTVGEWADHRGVIKKVKVTG